MSISRQHAITIESTNGRRHSQRSRDGRWRGFSLGHSPGQYQVALHPVGYHWDRNELYFESIDGAEE